MMGPRRTFREVGVPTVLRFGPYRFHFHSREHDPPHVHVESVGGRAVFVLVPIKLHESRGYTRRELRQIGAIVGIHRNTFLRRWHEHFEQ